MMTSNRIVCDYISIASSTLSNSYKSIQNYIGMAVPNTTETRCSDGSVQSRLVTNTKTTQIPPSLHLFDIFLLAMLYEITENDIIPKII